MVLRRRSRPRRRSPTPSPPSCATLAAYSCFEPFSNGPADELAERVVGLTPIPDARVFLCGSGSEAVDTAMKLARLAHALAGDPERTLIISRERGYHGTNLGGTSAQGIAPNREGWGPLVPDVVQVPSDDTEALAVLMAERAGEVAAVITEPVQGAGGVYPPPDGYLAELRRLCDRHGALLVFDEVITGFGRLGHVVRRRPLRRRARPDDVRQGGDVRVPAARWRRSSATGVRGPLEADPAFVLRHGYTYSGHPAACAAGLANLAIIEREGLVERAATVGERLGDGLRALAADGTIDHARGDGAVWAAGLRADQDAIGGPRPHARRPG